VKKDQQFKIALDWEMDQMIRRHCDDLRVNPQDFARQALIDALGGPSFLAVDGRIRNEIRKEMVKAAKSNGSERSVEIDPMDLPSAMGPCPNPECPSHDPSWAEWVLYGGDQPLIGISSSGYRCNGCGVTGP